jgi:hypothetical protein
MDVQRIEREREFDNHLAETGFARIPFTVRL